MPVTFQVEAMSPEWSFDDELGKVTGSTVWQVIASEPTTLAAAVNAVDATDSTKKIPAKGADMPGTTGCPCVKRSPKFVDGTRMLLKVTCDYDSEASGAVIGVARVSSSGEQTEESYFEDKTPGTPKLALHTNGRPFDELPRRNKSIRVFEIEKNVAASTTDASVADFENKVNNAAVTIGGRSCAAKTVLVSGVSLSEVKTLNGIDYKTLRSTARYNPDTWTQKFESRGIVDKDNKPKADADGNPLDDPWPLTTTGTFASTATTKGAEIALEPYEATSLSTLI